MFIYITKNIQIKYMMSLLIKVSCGSHNHQTQVGMLQFYSFGECGLLLYCNITHVHFDLELESHLWFNQICLLIIYIRQEYLTLYNCQWKTVEKQHKKCKYKCSMYAIP